MRTLAIIPAFNEEESIERTVERLIASQAPCDFVIVNDGSKDGTAERCRLHGYPFIDLPINLGLAGAFQAGMKYALKHGYDCAVQFDADGQHRPEFIARLAQMTADYDIVIGSRFAASEEKPHTLRMFGGSLISAAIRLTTGVRLLDPTSGMRAFNKRMIREMALGENLGPEPDTVSYLIKRAGARVAEVPVEMDERQAGESYLSPLKSAFYMVRMTVSILFIQLFRKSLKVG